jgi:hypothetical protein
VSEDLLRRLCGQGSLEGCRVRLGRWALREEIGEFVVVRVRLRVRSRKSGRSVEVAALASGGAESPRPCIVVQRGSWSLR